MAGLKEKRRPGSIWNLGFKTESHILSKCPYRHINSDCVRVKSCNKSYGIIRKMYFTTLLLHVHRITEFNIEEIGRMGQRKMGGKIIREIGAEMDALPLKSVFEVHRRAPYFNFCNFRSRFIFISIQFLSSCNFCYLSHSVKMVSCSEGIQRKEMIFTESLNKFELRICKIRELIVNEQSNDEV